MSEPLTADTELGLLTIKDIAEINGFSVIIARIKYHQFCMGTITLERLLRPKNWSKSLPTKIIHVLPKMSPAIKPRVYKSGEFRYRERMW